MLFLSSSTSFFSASIISILSFLFTTILILLSISSFPLLFFNNSKYFFKVILFNIFSNVFNAFFFISGFFTLLSESIISIFISSFSLSFTFIYIIFFHLLKYDFKGVLLIIFFNFLFFSEYSFSITSFLLSEIISSFSSGIVLLISIGRFSIGFSCSFMLIDNLNILFFKISSSFCSSGIVIVFSLLTSLSSYKSILLLLFSFSFSSSFF